jgi:hypothetical protein
MPSALKMPSKLDWKDERKGGHRMKERVPQEAEGL